MTCQLYIIDQHFESKYSLNLGLIFLSLSPLDLLLFAHGCFSINMLSVKVIPLLASFTTKGQQRNQRKEGLNEVNRKEAKDSFVSF